MIRYFVWERGGLSGRVTPAIFHDSEIPATDAKRCVATHKLTEADRDAIQAAKDAGGNFSIFEFLTARFPAPVDADPVS